MGINHSEPEKINCIEFKKVNYDNITYENVLCQFTNEKICFIKCDIPSMNFDNTTFHIGFKNNDEIYSYWGKERNATIIFHNNFKLVRINVRNFHSSVAYKFMANNIQTYYEGQLLPTGLNFDEVELFQIQYIFDWDTYQLSMIEIIYNYCAVKLLMDNKITIDALPENSRTTEIMVIIVKKILNIPFD